MIVLGPPLKKQVHKIKVERIVLKRRRKRTSSSTLFEAARHVTSSIANGFAQLASMGMTTVPSSAVIKSEFEALHDDWLKVGNDMRAGIITARNQVEKPVEETEKA